jgi:hypothetical protein
MRSTNYRLMHQFPFPTPFTTTHSPRGPQHLLPVVRTLQPYPNSQIQPIDPTLQRISFVYEPRRLVSDHLGRRFDEGLNIGVIRFGMEEAGEEGGTERAGEDLVECRENSILVPLSRTSSV